QSSEPLGFEPRRAPLWKRIAGRSINAPLTKVFCISDYVQRTLVRRDLLSAERFQTVYNAIVPPCLDRASELCATFRQRFGIPQGAELVTQVSWIIPEKGIPQLLDAARIVLAERPHAHFAIVGNGAYANEYRQKAEVMGIAHAITWTGLLQNPMEEG